MVLKKSFFYLFFFLPLGLGLSACRQSGGDKQEVLTEKGNGTAPEWSRDAVIYEVNVRQYSLEGTLAAVEAQLPRLAEMGVDILWLMPIHPIGEENRKGTLGSYYAVRDYRAINPEFGNAEDFHRFVDKAHELDMKVILDWVANHSAWDNPLTTQHPEWYTRDSLGNLVPPVADWSDVADFNYDNAALRNYMTDCLKYWVQEFDIDGYRCDVAGMVPNAFWDSVRLELDAIKPVFMLAEHESPESHRHGFDMTYGWEFHHLMNGVAKGIRSLDELDRYWKRQDSLYAPADYRMMFTSSHDENSWNGSEYERLGDAVEVMAVLSFTVPGMPMIYSGQEAALTRRINFFDRDPIEWNGYPLQSLYQRLCSLKEQEKALWNGVQGGDFDRLPSSDDGRIYAFTRGGQQVLCLFNLSDGPAEFQLSGSAPSGTFVDYFSGQSVKVEGQSTYSLPAWGYQVLIRS